MKDILYVGLGGGIGSILRYGISVMIMKSFDDWFPLPTFIANMTGSVIIGVLLSLAESQKWIGGDLRLFLMVGFCGGFTTFSTFAAENLKLITEGNITSAVIYMFISLIVVLFSVFGGYFIAQHFGATNPGT